MLTLNALFDLYEYTKRSENAVYFYQRDKSTIVMFKEAVKDSKLGLPKGYYVSEEELTQKLVLIGYVPFINANAVCKQLMKQYVLLYGNNNLAELISKVKYDKNYIGKALHIFDCYRGNPLFVDFEEKQVIALIKQWCEENHIPLEDTAQS